MSIFSPKRPECSEFRRVKMPVRPAFHTGQEKYSGELFRFPMSVLFFKRFLKRPLQIASIVPSSKVRVERVANKIDFERADIIAKYRPGAGPTSRHRAH